ncbi:hypothetical protein ACEN2J_15980 [Pseudorhodobacter sp. W20_MBD10_FR17]|uniref:hypothetical protein n=1 Tax=Pseudorhodobacter sp. W20_MBD10_FR17 TaxID=3240266 RepID=UPI003F9C3030
MSFLRNVAMAASIISAELATADTLTYGSLQYSHDVPNVLFLMGHIKSNDSFELRRAMRDQAIDLVVTASPGGNLYEGLQIAAILHDNKIGTYVPEGASCESSCANIFLGGTSRLLLGELGVHQFYSGGPDADNATSQSVTTAVTQYTTADIIGIMNQFDTPPFVYEKMFGTEDIYYFSGAQKARLNLGLDDTAFNARVTEVNAFLSQTPISSMRPDSLRAPATVANLPASVTPPVAPKYPTIEESAVVLLASINSDWSLPNEQALPRLAAYYAPGVDFFGKSMSHAEVMADKKAFAKRWPIRDYLVEPGSVRMDCSSEGCAIESTIAWVAASPQRGAKASGRSTWTLLLVASGGTLKIASEGGKTLKRN